MLKCTHNPARWPSLVKLLSWGWNPDLSDFKSRSFSLTCLCLSQPHFLPLSKCDLTSYSEQKSLIIFDTFDYSFLLKTWFPGHHNLLIFLVFRGHLFSVFFWFLISESFFYECPQDSLLRLLLFSSYTHYLGDFIQTVAQCTWWLISKLGLLKSRLLL